MKVLYVDLETTGLDPETCQILQIGLLWDHDSTIPIDQLPQLEFLVRHDSYRGDPYALWLNATLLQQLSKPGVGVPIGDVALVLSDVMSSWGITTKDRVNIGGKNIAGFDIPFLSKLPNFDRNGWDEWDSGTAMVDGTLHSRHKWSTGNRFQWRHRTVDPAMMYARPDDDMPPNLDECLKRAGIEKKTVHTALDDCKLVCELVRKGFEIQKEHADAYAAQSEYRTTASEPYTTAALQDTLHKLLTKPPTAQNEGSTASETVLQHIVKHGAVSEQHYPLADSEDMPFPTKPSWPAVTPEEDVPF